MANILQVTNPGMNDNRANINTQDPRTSQNNTRIQNPIDPTRVVRTDGKAAGLQAQEKERTVLSITRVIMALS